LAAAAIARALSAEADTDAFQKTAAKLKEFLPQN